LGYLFHCKECKYDLCKTCAQDYEKYGKKIEITAKCAQEHTLELHTKEPYENEVTNCDECKTESCINTSYLLHCRECKYNLCKNCDINRNGKKIYTIIKEEPLELSFAMIKKRKEGNAFFIVAIFYVCILQLMWFLCDYFGSSYTSNYYSNNHVNYNLTYYWYLSRFCIISTFLNWSQSNCGFYT
jgi:hypothetical protein